MFEEINREELVTLLKNPQKSDVERLAKDSEERTTTVIKDMMKQFADNYKWCHLNVLSSQETKNARSFSEDEEEILVVIERDIQEFKDRQS